MRQVDPQLRSQCPPASLLTDWQRGTLPAHLADDVQRHLAECDHCLDQLDADNADEPTDDPLLVALRAHPSCSDDEPEFQRLQETLLAHPPTTLGKSLAATLLWTAGAPASAGGRLPTLAELPYAFGNYELLAPIGRGSFGVVYRARHVRLHQTVAVKLLDAASCGGPEAVQDFLREMQAVGSLLHPAIIRATDAGQCAGLHYLVMEYIEGLDAARLLRQQGPWGPAEACEIVRQAAWGLDFAHRQGLVHRDVKPANLLVSSSGEVKLLDLGLAYRPEGAPRVSGLQTPLGTAEYMAPEQWQRSWQVDAKADLYSLGCTLFRLATGQLPYAKALAAGKNWQQCHCSEEPDWTPLADCAGHPAMLDVCRSLLAKDPAQRPDSAAVVAERLRDAAAPHRLTDWLAACGLAAPPSTAPRTTQPVAALPVANSDEPPPPSLPKAASGWSRRKWLVASSCGLAGIAWGLGRRWFRPTLSSQWRELAPAGARLQFNAEALPRGGWRLSVPLPTDGAAVHLLTLGRPLVAPFRLAVQLQTTSPAAGGGLFFQWRYHPADRQATFQSVELRPRGAGESPRLLWSGWEVQFGPAEPHATRIPWAEAPAPTASGPHHEVELALGVHGFPQIVWNGKRFDESLWTFSEEGRTARSAAPQRSPWSALGRLGLLHAAGELEFWSPRLAYDPEAASGGARL